jgi:hypothetical protein
MISWIFRVIFNSWLINIAFIFQQLITLILITSVLRSIHHNLITDECALCTHINVETGKSFFKQELELQQELQELQRNSMEQGTPKVLNPATQ